MVNKEISETITTTKAQQCIFNYSTKFYNSKTKKPTLQQTIIQSTVKPSVAQKYSQMDYQTFRPVLKASYKQHKNNFAEHNYNYVSGPKKTKTKTNTQIFTKSQNVPQPILNSVKFHDQPRSSKEQNGNYPFCQQRKNNANKYQTENQPNRYAQNCFPSDDDEYYNQNHQQFSSNQRPRSHSIDQPDIFEPYTRK